jgi:glycosyltransferase involved in cell wall biosynthesis
MFEMKRHACLTIKRRVLDAVKSTGYLSMVGDGPLAERCREVIRDLGIASQVQLHGFDGPKMISRLIREFSLFVLHSVTASSGDVEGLSVAILEAMVSEVQSLRPDIAGTLSIQGASQESLSPWLYCANRGVRQARRRVDLAFGKW